MHSLVVGESGNELVDVVHFSVQGDGVSREDAEEEHLGVGHLHVEGVEDGVNALGSVGGVVLVRDVVRSWKW